MAIYKGTALVKQIIGKLGNNDFMRWRNKNVVRESAPVVSNPNTEFQDAVRSALGGTATKWHNDYSETQKAAWGSFAQLSPGEKMLPGGILQEVKGNKGEFHGLDAAVKVNTQLLMAGMDAVDAPPIAESLPAEPLIDNIWFNGEYLYLTWFTRLWPTGSKCRIWIDSTQESFHKQILGYTLAENCAYSDFQVRAAAGADLLLEDLIGQDVIVQCDIIAPSGAISRAGNTKTLRLLIGVQDEELRRPNSDDNISLTPFPGGGEDNYEDVDEEVHDDDATYVTTAGAPLADFYGLPDSAIRSYNTIRWICVSGWVKGTAGQTIKLGFETTVGHYQWTKTLVTSDWEFVTTGNQFINPLSGVAYTFAEIYQAVVSIQLDSNAQRCTQLYVEVADDYHPDALWLGNGDFDFGNGTPPVFDGINVVDINDMTEEQLERARVALEREQAEEVQLLTQCQEVLADAIAANEAGGGADWLLDYRAGTQDAAENGDPVAIAGANLDIDQFIAWLQLTIVQTNSQLALKAVDSQDIFDQQGMKVYEPPYDE